MKKQTILIKTALKIDKTILTFLFLLLVTGFTQINPASADQKSLNLKACAGDWQGVRGEVQSGTVATPDALICAIEADNLSIVQFLIESQNAGGTTDDRIENQYVTDRQSCGVRSFDSAIIHQRLEILKYLLALKTSWFWNGYVENRGLTCPYGRSLNDRESDIVVAIKEDNSDILEAVISASYQPGPMQQIYNPGKLLPVWPPYFSDPNQAPWSYKGAKARDYLSFSSTDSFTHLTPLCVAAITKHPDLVKRLIQLGAKPENEDSDGLTALSCASFSGDLDSTKILIQAGWDPNFAAGKSFPNQPLYLAVLGHQLEMIQYLVQVGKKIDIATAAHDTPLSLAIRLHQLDVVQTLVHLGANIASTESPSQPISATTNVAAHAITFGSIEILRYFLSLPGFNTGDFGNNPLLVQAAQANRLDMVQFLLSVGANPNSRRNNNPSYLTPVLAATDFETIKTLIAAHANVNDSFSFQDSDRITHQRGVLEEALLYLDSSDTTVPDFWYQNYHLTPTAETFLVALNRDHKANVGDSIFWAVKWVLDHASVPLALSFAVEREIKGLNGYNPQTMSYMLDHGVNPNEPLNDYGETLMYNLGWSFYPDYVAILVSHGGNVNVQDKAGNTPLMVAAQTPHPGMIPPLLKAGARLDIKNNQSKTVCELNSSDPSETANIRQMLGCPSP